MDGAADESLRVCIYCRVALALVPEAGSSLPKCVLFWRRAGLQGLPGPGFPTVPGVRLPGKVSSLLPLQPSADHIRRGSCRGVTHQDLKIVTPDSTPNATGLRGPPWHVFPLPPL